MKALLQRLPTRDGFGGQQVGKILAAFGQPGSPSPAIWSLPVPLTWREQEILDLLATRLQNKEISVRLNISPVTVKSHLRNIYQKLDVRKRREAVACAEELGIVRNP